MITYNNSNYYYYQDTLCKRRDQIQDLQGVFTACTLPLRPHSALSNTLSKRQAAAFVLSMFKINTASLPGS